MGGIYVHIPFCRTHCTYCAFYSELVRDASGSEPFTDALIREIRAEASPGRISTLYFGGGTPSVLDARQTARITEALKKSFDLSGLEEFTFEVNPDDILRHGSEYLVSLQNMGVDRISMGVQSFDDTVLRRMGRRHNAEGAARAYAMLRGAGFANISIDLIFGFSAGLDTGHLQSGLLGLGTLPEHISCYQLGIEEGSGLDRMLRKGLFAMPSDEECERQYYAVCDMLRSLGYEHYEISNWAMPGRHSRHNSSYWHHVPYLGLGPGAHSLFISPEGEYMRRWNDSDLAGYIRASQGGDWDSVRGHEILTEEQKAEERLFLGLRTAEGVDGRRIPESKWFISDSIIADML